MPVGVVILIRLHERPSNEQLQSWRKCVLEDLNLEGEYEDFDHGGPLIYVEDWTPFDDDEGVWLDLNLVRAYYGVGYERGDIEFFARCAEWIEDNLSNPQIFYGTDASR